MVAEGLQRVCTPSKEKKYDMRTLLSVCNASTTRSLATSWASEDDAMATGGERTGEGGFDEPLRRLRDRGEINDGRFSVEQDAEGREGSGEGDENRTSCTSPEIIPDSRVMGNFFFFLLLLVLSE